MRLRSTDPNGRLVVIGSDLRWQRRVSRLAERAGLVPEIMSWEVAAGIEPPVCGILVRVAATHGVLGFFRTWATRGLQPICVVFLESSPGAAALKAELAGLGFERILLARPWAREEGYWSDVEAQLAELAAPNLVLVPIVVGMLGRSDSGLVRLVSAVVKPPVPSTVEGWRRRIGVSRRELDAMLRDLGLPRPKQTLDLLRVALAVHLGTLGHGKLDQIARATAFGSGDYLGRRCRRLTGHSYGDLVLVRSGVSRVVRLLEAG